jgi:hypothetical protein
VKTLLHVFPEYDWQLWRFVHAPKGFWEATQNVHDFMQHACQHLQLSGSEFHLLDSTSISGLGGKTLLNKTGGVNTLVAALPLRQSSQFDAKTKTQQILYKTLQEVFQSKM